MVVVVVAVGLAFLRGIDVQLPLGCPFCWWTIFSIFAPFPAKKIAVPPLPVSHSAKSYFNSD